MDEIYESGPLRREPLRAAGVSGSCCLRYNDGSPIGSKVSSRFLTSTVFACYAACFLSCGDPEPSGRLIEATPLFRDVAEQSGLGFSHFTGSTGQYFLPEIMSSGVALLDYDGDGDLDVYLLQGTMLDQAKPPGQAKFPPPEDHWPGNRLFRNELIPANEMRFIDVTADAGIGHEGYGMGAAVGDIDNDGDPDLYVTNFGANVLYQNNGDGTFSDITRQAGVDDPRWSASAAFLDYDRDGRLDLFVTNYIDFTIRNNKACSNPTGARDYCTPTIYNPVPDRLFRNLGAAKFADVSAKTGIDRAFGNGLGVTAADFNSDGWIDLYVANDGTPNQLWISQDGARFENSALMGGAAINADGLPEAGMGVTAGDFDSDGDEDLFMTHLTRETNTLYLNNGKGSFHDATNRYGLGSVSLAFTGFGAQWFDYDNDGRLDLFVANGGVTIMESLRGSPYPFLQTNQLFQGGAAGRFRDVTASAGPVFDLAEVSRGAAFGDLDHDGDIDIVVSNNNGPVRLLRNEAGGGHWLQVRLEGVESNRDGLGARVALLRPGEPIAWRRAHTDGSYLSASSRWVHFGLGENATVEGIGVLWPNGRAEIWKDVRPGERITLRETTGQPWTF